MQERRVPDSVHQMFHKTAASTKSREQTHALRRMGEDSFWSKGWFKELGLQC